MTIRVLSSAANHVKFASFDNPTVVEGDYITLSHRWQDVEQSHEETLLLAQEEVAIDSPRLSTKVRECHRLARAYGCPWFWVDAPCIDQRNSAELSEAIASMYDWYARAKICFAFLVDVPPDDIIRAPGSAFRRSVYFRRGWTLQELIAPRRVVFLYNDWSVLGDKDELADLLEEITGIDHDVLTSRRALSDVSVARRLSWSSQRETSRVEDRAYSLMGLFDIHIPVMYGEGEKAFTRLQAKIFQAVPDHTILAWSSSQSMAIPTPTLDTRSSPIRPPFAPSPAAFTTASRFVAVDIQQFMEVVAPLCKTSHPESPSLPRFGSVNHHGMKCKLPVLCFGSTPFAALLACREDHFPSSLIAIALRHEHSLVAGVYDVGVPPGPSGPSTALDWSPSRLLRVNLDLIAPLLDTRGGSAQATLERPAMNIRFMSFHIATTIPTHSRSTTPRLHPVDTAFPCPPTPVNYANDTNRHREADGAHNMDAGTRPQRPSQSSRVKDIVSTVIHHLESFGRAVEAGRCVLRDGSAGYRNSAVASA